MGKGILLFWPSNGGFPENKFFRRYIHLLKAGQRRHLQLNCYIRSWFFNVSPFRKSMAIQTGAEMLAELLGKEREQVSRLLDQLSGSMAAELLGSGRLAIEGLGTFSVVHDHAVRETTEKGQVFMPPKNRIAFDPRLPARGDISRIAAGRLGMEAGESADLVKALSAMFGELRKRQVDLELRGFGSFTMSDGRYCFLPDPGFEGLLNSAYEGLEGIAMPEGAGKAPGGSPKLKPLLIAVAAILLIFVGYVSLRPLLSGDGARQPVQKGPSPAYFTITEIESPEAAPSPSIVTSVPNEAVPDSLVLSKGRFTVVAATFYSAKVAQDEARRLSAPGRRIMIWKVHSGGQFFYRLVTGDYATGQEARDSLRTMRRGLSKNVYIQQASKNVVLYGENGL
jgi:nucleoid DNA-binding protein